MIIYKDDYDHIQLHLADDYDHIQLHIHIHTHTHIHMHIYMYIRIHIHIHVYCKDGLPCLGCFAHQSVPCRASKCCVYICTRTHT